MRALVGLSLVCAASVAHADDTFETAQRVKRIEDLVWTLTATCEGGTDTQQRQCKRIRDTRVAQLANATLVVDADREAFTIGAWSAKAKSSSLALSSCIRCTGVSVDGKTWFVTGTKEGNPAPAFAGGKLKVGSLLESSRTFADAASAKKFADDLATAKIQMLVKVPAKPRWTADGRPGIALDVIGFRVYSPCDGALILGNPKGVVGEVDKRACAGIPATGEVDALTPAMIKESIKPVLDAAKACYGQFKTPGKTKLKLQIAADGSVAEVAQEGDFGNTATGQCIDAAARTAAFPKSKKPRTAVAIPITLP